LLIEDSLFILLIRNKISDINFKFHMGGNQSY